MNPISNQKTCMSLDDLETPALVLDQGRMARNIARAIEQAHGIKEQP